ncbi:MAG TPA: helix-turn-helix domain-containing protein [Bacteroidales bacterium]|nr:helix-turn-helix domain-containing protein [Bacteroidales bacterium]
MQLTAIHIPVNMPPRLDLFSLLILLGVFQGVFLAYFFLNRENRKVQSNMAIGLFVLAMSLTISEIFLNYSNFILKVVWINDFSEPLNFVYGPFWYFYVRTSLGFRFRKRDWWHFIPFFLYLGYMMFYFMQPWQEKYNSFVWAYHPELEYLNYTRKIPLDPWHIRQYVNELTWLHMISYALISFFVVKREFNKAGLSIFRRTEDKLKEIRLIIINVFVVIGIYVFVKIFVGRDLGDIYVAAYMSVIIYMISFKVVRRSLYFGATPATNEENKPKYQKSSLSDGDKRAILAKITQLFDNDKYYLDSLVSLPLLAKKIGEAQHHVSQVINELLNQNFFEMIAFYRIEEAKRILLQSEFQFITIEELAEKVGYNSKSAFNKAFKKHTGLTPSQFRDSQIH